MAKLIALMKKLALMLSNCSPSNSPPSAATSANSTDSTATRAGFAVSRRAAAAGVIARLSTSSVPTICAASVTVTART